MRIMTQKEAQLQFGTLESIQTIGSVVGLTDLALILGGGDDNWKSADGRQTGDVWTSTSNGYNLIYTMQQDTNTRERSARCRHMSVRPVLSKMELSLITPKNKRTWRPADTMTFRSNERAKYDREVQLFDYGTYPQDVVADDLSKQLEDLYQQKKLKETGACFTFDRETSEQEPFSPIQYAEYAYKGKQYIRVEKGNVEVPLTLSNGKTLEVNEHRGIWNQEKQKWEKDLSVQSETYWVEVKPLTWVQDPSGIAYTLDAVIAGLQYNFDGYKEDFTQTDLYQHLQNFQKEIIQPRTMPAERQLNPIDLKKQAQICK